MTEKVTEEAKSIMQDIKEKLEPWEERERLSREHQRVSIADIESHRCEACGAYGSGNITLAGRFHAKLCTQCANDLDADEAMRATHRAWLRAWAKMESATHAGSEGTDAVAYSFAACGDAMTVVAKRWIAERKGS